MLSSLASGACAACLVATIVPGIGASTTPQLQISQNTPKVFVLGPASNTQTAALNNALHTLGYASYATPEYPSFTNIDAGSTDDLLWSSDYALIASQVQDAKFILPRAQSDDSASRSKTVKGLKKRSKSSAPAGVSKTDLERSSEAQAYQNYTRSVRDFFADSGRASQLLEISVDAPEPDMVLAEKWLRLCDFLGLGYSIVERLKLKDFPVA